MSVVVIGEAGSCHDGSLDRAHQLVLAAKAAGCDVVKFQWWSSAKRLAERRRAGDYQAIYERYQMPRPWLDDLAAFCADTGIEFMCTSYLPEDVPVVAPYVQRFKVASFEAGDREFLEAHRPFDTPLVVSTGMTDREEALDLAYRRGVEAILHCVSAYPCPPEQANLAAIGTLRRLLPTARSVRVGFSDHTRQVATGALAVAAGAEVLEVHFRLDDTPRTNPDYPAALSPKDLKHYVAFARRAEQVLGDGVKRPMAAEGPMMKYRVLSTGQNP